MLVFRQPYSHYMLFNNLSMQIAYYAKHRQIRDVHVDYIYVDKAQQWINGFSINLLYLRLLESYLH